MPIMMLQTYNRILPSHGIGTLVLLIFGVVCAVILEVGLRLAHSYLTGWAGVGFEHKTACAAMMHLLNSGQALMTVVDLPFVLTFLFLIASIGDDIVLVPLTLFLLFCTISWIVDMRLKKKVKEQDFSDNFHK